MATGTIKTWKGSFGFIVDEDGGGDIYFNLKTNPDLEDRKKSLVNERVVFEKRQSTKFPDDPNKFEAYNVRFQATSSQQSKQSTSGRKQSASPSQGTGKSKSVPDATPFHNPYTFVPTPPRPSNGFAGDFNPLKCGLDHASLNPKLWTGHIPIKLTTITPLVLPKTEGKDYPPDKPYDVLDYIPESSLRGMLRSAYEVVTNSRYACFHNPDRLTYRMGREKIKYQKSPEELLHSSLKPAKCRSELSPAERLFGWVLQKGDQDQQTDTEDENKRGYKSRIRVVCENGVRPFIVEDFKSAPLPLTILGQPKPEQARFYVAKDARGNPQDDGISKSDAGYEAGKALRGRKHYWHHKGYEAENKPNYWDPMAKNREYRRTGDETDSQNRSIQGWIKSGTKFKVSLYVQNLQCAEVGTLLWLLSLPEGHYFRLGYGKPLGFGSLTMEIDKKRLRDGCIPLGTSENWKAYYADLDACSPATLDENMQSKCIQQFQDSMKDAYQEQNFNNLSFIEGFLQILRGPGSDDPIHYPRRNRTPDPEGKNYEWFMDNENGRKRYEDGRKIALPAVTAKEGLPYNPSKPRPR